MPFDADKPETWPDRVRRLHRRKPKRARQWVHVFNGVLEQTGDEGRAYAAANATVPEAVKAKVRKFVVTGQGLRRRE